jgi:hypothetical protein
MRVLPTRVHGVIDYLWGAALLGSPWLLGYSDVTAATWIALIFGLGAFAYSAVTDYELGLLRVLPMLLHLWVDGVGGAVLAASPWLFGFADRVVWPQVLFGLFSVLASLVTRTDPAQPSGVRRPA